MMTNQQKKFYSLVNKELFEEYGYNRYYKQIKIIYNQENMITALPVTEIQLQKLMLNNEVVDYLNNEAEKINNSWIDSYENGETDKYPYIYLKAQQMLVNELIKPIPANKRIEIKQLLEQSDKEELDSLFNY